MQVHMHIHLHAHIYMSIIQLQICNNCVNTKFINISLKRNSKTLSKILTSPIFVLDKYYKVEMNNKWHKQMLPTHLNLLGIYEIPLYINN